MSTNHRIMVVDDEPDLLRMVELYLKAWHFKVDAFTQPAEALEHFKKNPSAYSLVITDIRMPDMTGLELARHVLHIKQDMKIMLMTAFQVDTIELESNMPIIRHQDILKKPFRLVEICTGVKKQLQIATP
ncbi:MAG TPA: response regulator [Nitrososphaera sp.]|jgi:two-component system, cell cycle response regulator CpdR|nr:response regulator [Nitrososphaera sp.]HEX2614489.1 response regulator [Nitrososphaera sp.]